jgi:hypothetical protein
MMKPVNIQTGQLIAAGDLTLEFEMMGRDLNSVVPSNSYPENIVIYSTISAMSGSEVMDFYGQAPGMSAYAATVLSTQINLKTDESTVVRTMLKAADVGPLDKLKIIANAEVTAAEKVDLVIISW